MYYGRLTNIECIDGNSFVLVFKSYTATEFYGKDVNIRIYVPTDLNYKIDNLMVGEEYLIIAAPYRATFNKAYKFRVDMLLNIFQEV